MEPVHRNASIVARAKRLVGRLVADEGGAAVLEYVLIAGLIVVVAIAVIAAFGGKVLARWTSVNSSL